MITGHLGVAGVVGGVSRAKMNSGIFVAFVLASIAPDIADAGYSILGICNPYALYSHTLHAVVLEAAIVGGMTFLATGSRVTALAFAFVVLLHVPADYFTGRKLLLPGGEMVGLLWYERPLYDYLLEVPTVLLGWWLLRRGNQAPRWATSVWALVFVVVVQTAFDVAATRTSQAVKASVCFNVPAVSTANMLRNAQRAMLTGVAAPVFSGLSPVSLLRLFVRNPDRVIAEHFNSRAVPPIIHL